MSANRIKALVDAYAHTFLNPGDFHQPEKNNLYNAIDEMQRELDEARAALNDRIENVARLNGELDAVRAELNKANSIERFKEMYLGDWPLDKVQEQLNKIGDRTAENNGQDTPV